MTLMLLFHLALAATATYGLAAIAPYAIWLALDQFRDNCDNSDSGEKLWTLAQIGFGLITIAAIGIFFTRNYAFQFTAITINSVNDLRGRQIHLKHGQTVHCWSDRQELRKVTVPESAEVPALLEFHRHQRQCTAQKRGTPQSQYRQQKG
ncbi:hypothetical protein [Rhodococcus sp. OK302]|uniref:hypothetical protein n=1 Tax=Rhodococcus sp. OK302 TaxID=1882769 RepID=UPI00113FC9A4|nr:hypothetical protein [Rhodococcus sp. OK302]